MSPIVRQHGQKRSAGIDELVLRPSLLVVVLPGGKIGIGVRLDVSDTRQQPESRCRSVRHSRLDVL